jgi:hypothetical protein
MLPIKVALSFRRRKIDKNANICAYECTEHVVMD